MSYLNSALELPLTILIPLHQHSVLTLNSFSPAYQQKSTLSSEAETPGPESPALVECWDILAWGLCRCNSLSEIFAASKETGDVYT